MNAATSVFSSLLNSISDPDQQDRVQRELEAFFEPAAVAPSSDAPVEMATHRRFPNLLTFIRYDIQERAYIPVAALFLASRPEFLFLTVQWKHDSHFICIMALQIHHEQFEDSENELRKTGTSSVTKLTLNPLQSLLASKSKIKFIPVRSILESSNRNQSSSSSQQQGLAGEIGSDRTGNKRRKTVNTATGTEETVNPQDFKNSVPWAELAFRFVGYQFIPVQRLPPDLFSPTAQMFEMN